MTSNSINSIGLALDIVGVVLLFLYGLPSATARSAGLAEWAPEPGSEEDRHIRRQWVRRQRTTWLGAVLLVLGFALQIASNHIDAPSRGMSRRLLKLR